MKHFSLFLLAFLAIFQSVEAQTNKIVATYIRAEEGLRVGTNSSQQISGFNTTIPAIATDTKLPTTKAVKDYVNASFVPLGGTASGDLSGTWPSPTVDGLQGVAVSATSPATNQVLKYNGSAWAAGAEADPSITNELQSLSVSGQNLTLSGGGGTVAVPVDGNGPYSGSGTIPTGTVATVAENFLTTASDTDNETSIAINAGAVNILSSGTGGSASLSVSTGSFFLSGSQSFSFQDPGGDRRYFNVVRSGNDTEIAIGSDVNLAPFPAIKATNSQTLGAQSTDFYIAGAGGYIKVTDESNEKFGIQYKDDYSATIATNDPSVVDVRTIKSGLLPFIIRQISDSTALPGEIFFSTDTSQLSYKDSSGTVHAY